MSGQGVIQLKDYQSSRLNDPTLSFASLHQPQPPQLMLRLQPQEVMQQPTPPQLQPPPAPSLRIVEQPVRYYRFRYPSEVEGSRLGGLLLGRSSESGGKGFMKLQISGIDPRVHASLKLMVCTVDTDKRPHPYFLHGDKCHDGYYEEQKTIDEKSAAEWNVCFEKLAVICVPQKSADIQGLMQARAAKIPKLHDCPETSEASHKRSNLGKILLAFSLAYTDKLGRSWVTPTVFSDEIQDGKEKNKVELSLDSLNPEELPQGCESTVAIYTKVPTTGLLQKDVKVVFTLLDDNAVELDAKISFECDLEDMKKHLLIVKSPILKSQDSRVRCQVSARCNDFQTKEKLYIAFIEDSTCISAPIKKLKRHLM